MPSVEPPKLDSPHYLKGTERVKYAEYVSQLYSVDKMTVRQIARLTNRGFATIHELLHEHGTEMRPEGRPMGFHPPRRPRHKHPVGHEELTSILEGVVEERRNGEWKPVR